MTLRLNVREETWRLNKPFKISRETEYDAHVVYCEIGDGLLLGRAEAAGASYKGETPASIMAEIESHRAAIEAGIDVDALQELMPVPNSSAGARNAIDCALWDLEAKRAGRTIWQILGIEAKPVTTVYTIGIDEPDKMAADADAHEGYPAFKIKVGIGDPIIQVAAIRAAAPDADIIIDANQAWSIDQLKGYAPGLADLGVAMIEQPLAVGEDGALESYTSPVPLGADESCDTSADLERLQGLYQVVNIKLDKTGGLTEALKLSARAREMGFDLMVGNMLGSSLAMAPAFVIAQACRFVDLDGPLLQAEDRDFGMEYVKGVVSAPRTELWG